MNAHAPTGCSVDPAEAAVKRLTDLRRRAGHLVAVDLFCGTGGSSQGFRGATGYSPVLAVNHAANAIAVHTANHPDTVHLERSVYKVQAWKMFARGVVDLLMASPDCTHHSRAKGGRPLDKGIRDLAWVVSEWAREAAPKVILVENVSEFQDWGPLHPDDHRNPKLRGRPIKARKGETFRSWVQHLRLAGYRVEWRVLAACDYGAPTTRKRLFVQARCDGKAITWPKPTHAAPEKAPTVGLPAWRTAAECIDWSIPMCSIFATPDEARTWRDEVAAPWAMEQGLSRPGIPSRPLAENTMRRIAAGVRKYVLDAERPFLLNLSHGGRLEPLSEPCRTLTATPVGGDRALVSAVISKARSQGWDRGAGPSWSADQPLITLTTTEQLTLVQAALAPAMVTNNTNNAPGSVGAPLRTVTTGGRHILTAASLVQVGYGERKGQAPRTLDIQAPLGTVVAGGPKHAVFAALLAKHNGTTEGKHNAGQALDEPVATITGKAPMGPVACHLTQLYGSADAGRSLDGPMPTVTSGGGRGGGHSGLVQVDLDGVDAEHLANTNAGAVYAFLTKYYGEGSISSGLDEPIHTLVSKARMGLVLVYVGGEPWVITDIRMRMLTPRELATAQGFPSDYQLGVETSTKGDEIEGIGNSVSPPVMTALVGSAFRVEPVRAAA